MESWKNKENKDKNSPKKTSGEGLFVSNRQLSFVVAGNIILLFTTFVLGYFWGQKYAVEHFVDKMHNDSFADQIYSSLFSLQEGSVTPENSVQFPIVSDTEQSICKKESDEQDAMTSHLDNKPSTVPINYYAQLIGFGTLKAANRFVNRLQKKNISVKVKKRVSKTVRGKVIAWYQVVTKEYTDKSVLEKLVATLKKDEKLKDPSIIIC